MTSISRHAREWRPGRVDSHFRRHGTNFNGGGLVVSLTMEVWHMRKILMAGVLTLTLAPVCAFAQDGSGAAAGAATGVVGGAIVGGPIGAVVGGVGGAIVGGIADADRTRFRTYVEERHVA